MVANFRRIPANSGAKSAKFGRFRLISESAKFGQFRSFLGVLGDFGQAGRDSTHLGVRSTDFGWPSSYKYDVPTGRTPGGALPRGARARPLRPPRPRRPQPGGEAPPPLRFHVRGFRRGARLPGSGRGAVARPSARAIRVRKGWQDSSRAWNCPSRPWAPVTSASRR